MALEMSDFPAKGIPKYASYPTLGVCVGVGGVVYWVLFGCWVRCALFGKVSFYIRLRIK